MVKIEKKGTQTLVDEVAVERVFGFLSITIFTKSENVELKSISRDGYALKFEFTQDSVGETIIVSPEPKSENLNLFIGTVYTYTDANIWVFKVIPWKDDGNNELLARWPE